MAKTCVLGLFMDCFIITDFMFLLLTTDYKFDFGNEPQRNKLN